MYKRKILRKSKSVNTLKEKEKYFWLRGLFEIFKNHPTLILSILYGYFSFIGILYSFTLLDKFNVNIFDYSDLTDFLIVTFRTPKIFTYPIVLVSLILFSDILQYLGKKYILPKGGFKRPIMTKLYFEIIPSVTKYGKYFTIPFLFIIVFGIAYDAAVKQSEYLLDPNKYIYSSNVQNKFYLQELLFPRPIDIPEAIICIKNKDTVAQRFGRILPSPNKYIFLFNKKDSSVIVFPRSEIVEIKYKK